MRAFLISGNPGSGKSTLAAELSRRGHVAIDADDLASWEDRSGWMNRKPEPTRVRMRSSTPRFSSRVGEQVRMPW
jgi:broad-specificity NMP kinase